MPAETARWICIVTLVAGVLAARVAWAIDTAYVYDEDGQLREIIRNDGWQIILDYDEAGNLIARDVEPTTSADLSVSISDSPDPVDDGMLLTYVATISNAGPDTATNVTLSMTVPSINSVQAISASQGSCITGSAMSCDLGTLAAGTYATVGVEVTAVGPLPLDAFASVSATDYDPDLANNTAAESTVVNSDGGPLIYLTLGKIDPGQYGYGFGSSLHRDGAILVFDRVAEDLLFTVIGHDVDSALELSLILNDTPIGYLGVGPNDGENRGDTFLIPASSLVAGPNQLRIEQLVSGAKWGVTELLLSIAGDFAGPPVTLLVGTPHRAAYGWNFGPSLHLTELIANFEGTTEVLYLLVAGYDLEFPDEVTVWVNGSPFGSLMRGKDASRTRWSWIEIRPEDQVPGTNEVRFQKGFGDSTWGMVTLGLWKDGR